MCAIKKNIPRIAAFSVVLISAAGCGMISSELELFPLLATGFSATFYLAYLKVKQSEKGNA